MNQWTEDEPLDAQEYVQPQTEAPDGLELPIRIALAALYSSIVINFYLGLNFMRFAVGASLLATGILYSIRYSKLRKREMIHHFKLLLVIVANVYFVNLLMRLFYFRYGNIVLLMMIAYWAYAGQNDRLDSVYDERSKAHPAMAFIYRLCSSASIGMILLGALFKIQHWPYSSLLMISGFCMLTISIITGYFVDPNRRYF